MDPATITLLSMGLGAGTGLLGGLFQGEAEAEMLRKQMEQKNKNITNALKKLTDFRTTLISRNKSEQGNILAGIEMSNNPDKDRTLYSLASNKMSAFENSLDQISKSAMDLELQKTDPNSIPSTGLSMFTGALSGFGAGLRGGYEGSRLYKELT